MNIKIETLDKISEVNKMCWISSDSIINSSGREISIKYSPDEEICEKEFGIHDLSLFINYIKTFKETELIFQQRDIVIKEKDKDSGIVFRMYPSSLMEDKLAADSIASTVFGSCKRLIENGKYLKFKITKDDVARYKKLGGLIKSSNNDAVLTFSKQPDEQDLSINISCKSNDDYYTDMINEIEDKTEIGTLKSSILIDNLLDGNWDAYIFHGSKVSMKNKKGQSKTKPIKEMFMYMVDPEEKIELIISFIN
jgi:hypothetical protein